MPEALSAEREEVVESDVMKLVFDKHKDWLMTKEKKREITYAAFLQAGTTSNRRSDRGLTPLCRLTKNDGSTPKKLS